MRVFITGATGFIGSHVARLLVKEGHEVFAAVRPESNLWRIADVAPSLRILPCDLQVPADVDAHVTNIRPDLCFHLAWYAEPGKYLASPHNISLLSSSLNLAQRLASLGCKRLVAAGTCFEYDTALGYLSESSQTKPGSLYAASKLALQLVLDQLTALHVMSVAWVRLFYQYGPFEDQRRLVPSVVCSLLRNQLVNVTAGGQIRDYLHVEDVATAILAVGKSDLSGPVNIGSGNPVAVRQILASIGALLDRAELIAIGALPYGATDPTFICANNRRLVDGTGWAPHFDLDQGLRHTIQWWQRHLESQPGSIPA